MAGQANDLISTDRGQSKQCAQEHRSENRSWQTAVAAKCSSTRVTAEIIVSFRKTSKTIKHSKRLSSRRDDVERELVLRLASLLWRMRRASAIETDLFQI
jgi:hypothetical protein